MPADPIRLALPEAPRVELDDIVAAARGVRIDATAIGFALLKGVVRKALDAAPLVIPPHLADLAATPAAMAERYALSLGTDPRDPASVAAERDLYLRELELAAQMIAAGKTADEAWAAIAGDDERPKPSPKAKPSGARRSKAKPRPVSSPGPIPLPASSATGGSGAPLPPPPAPSPTPARAPEPDLFPLVTVGGRKTVWIGGSMPTLPGTYGD